VRHLRPITAPRVQLLTLTLSVTLTLALTHATPASATAPWWKLTSSQAPTLLPSNGEGKIVVTATNLGDASASATTQPVTINDTLPPGVHATAIHGFSGEGPRLLVGLTLPEAGEVKCTLSVLNCTYTSDLPPYEPLRVEITVVDANAGQSEQNDATISGGGAQPAAISQPLQVADTATPFSIEKFAITPENEGGGEETQAGSHPFQLTTMLSISATLAPNATFGASLPKPVALTKDLRLNLPPGLVGNPNAVAQCSELQFANIVNFVNQCPADSAIGVASVTVVEPQLFLNIPHTIAVPVFNLPPAVGEPARFGFEVFEVPVIFDTSVRSGRDYGVTVSVNDASEKASLLNSVVTLWGVPGDPRHDQSRGWACVGGGVWAESTSELCSPSRPSQPPPFLTLPTSCAGASQSTVELDSWSHPGAFASGTSAFSLEGCDGLPFSPSISVAPDGRAASTPTGLTVGVHVPQETTRTSTGLGEADIKSTTVSLPTGMELSPSAADGLLACSTQQIGFEGVDAQTHLLDFSSNPPTCPPASKLASVNIKTPLLANELTGGVYLAAQGANPFASLIALYLVARDPVSGVLVKLPGQVSLNEHTGQVSATFANTPELPFEDLRMEFFGGARAPLTTPSECGSYTTSASFSPWSAGPAASPSSSFAITSGPNGSPCTSPLPFSPSLVAGPMNIQAAVFTPFATTISREDGNQNLVGVTLHMPPGLLGKLSSVNPCQEPQAAQATCGPESLIGHTVASVGLGPDPYTISGGKVFITGAYRGAPYGLSIAQPAKAGPFDLGTGACDCVVVRAKIEIDTRTSALTVVSDPLPTILQGIPVQLKHVNVTVDRPGFTFNPTNCSQLAISATLSGEQGAIAPVSVPFEVANCATLPFKPTFKVLTQARTSKANGASLHVKVTSGPGQANIGKVKVDLPKQLPSRLTTLQKACRDATFNANPASCPAGSVVGTATAVTPVLKSPLTGPAYLVSHAGAAFPDLVIILQGEGITLDLVGNTDIKHGITISNFNAVPDAPISTFDLVLPEGPHSALAAFGNLCKSKLNMPTAITGQNGAVIKQTTRVAVAGCPKHKKARKAKTHKSRRRAKK
jgi:hypothetical protein